MDFDLFCSSPFMPCTDFLGSDLQYVASVSRWLKTRVLGGGDEFQSLCSKSSICSVDNWTLLDHWGRCAAMLWLAFGGFTNVPRLVSFLGDWSCLVTVFPMLWIGEVAWVFPSQSFCQETVRTACCSAAHFGLSFRKNCIFPSVQ